MAEQPYPNTYWLPEHRLLAGEYPGSWHETEARQKIRQLLKAGVTYFLDLTEVKERLIRLTPYEGVLRQEAEARGSQVVYQRLSIRDIDVPTREGMLQILDAIDQALAAGHTVYIHCWGGIGRTGTVVGCFLVRHGLSGQAALQEIARLRAGSPKARRTSPETYSQQEMVLNWSETKAVKNG